MLQFDSDVEDALWFQGRSWRSLTRDDWHKHYCAVHFFAPEAFLYYLQSLLILTIEAPGEYPDLAVDSVLNLLDLSLGVENWNQHLRDSFFGLSDDEYAALKEWLVWASEHVQNVFFGRAEGGPGDGFGRAFDTIVALQKAAVLHRQNSKTRE